MAVNHLLPVLLKLVEINSKLMTDLRYLMKLEFSLNVRVNSTQLYNNTQISAYLRINNFLIDHNITHY